MFKFLKAKILKQHNIGGSIGGLKDLTMRTMFYVSALNFIMLVITSYSVSLRDFMGKYVEWFSFPIFFGILILILIISMIIEYKFILPSQWQFANKQQYEHKNPIRLDLEEIKDRMTKIEEHLGIEGKK